MIKNHLMPTFGHVALRDISPVTVQRYLSDLKSSKLSHESMDKIRDTLSSVLGSAVNYEYLVKNPVEGLKLPPDRKGKGLSRTLRPNSFRR